MLLVEQPWVQAVGSVQLTELQAGIAVVELQGDIQYVELNRLLLDQ